MLLFLYLYLALKWDDIKQNVVVDLFKL